MTPGRRTLSILATLVMVALGRDGEAAVWKRGKPAPPPQRDHAMAYDGERGVTVMFGAEETWAYDGARWRDVGAAGPRSTFGHGMVYDRFRQRVVLFGGYAGAPLAETWEYDGTAWHPGPAPPPSLPARLHHAMAYDSRRNLTIVHGGAGGGSLLADTWEYDGIRWAPGATAPPGLHARLDHAMAYDPARARTVLFGGRDPTQWFDDTWELGPTGWQQNPTSSGLGPRVDHAMVYDAGRGRVLLFGGMDGVLPDSSETWLYDGATWEPGPPAPAEEGRHAHAMVWDERRDRVLMFGGDRDGSHPLGDTWELDAAGWSEANGSVPDARCSFAIAYHEGLGVVVIYGGYDQPLEVEDGTWAYDGVAWKRLASSPLSMPSRYGSAMAYDARSDRLVLFGGGHEFTALGDAWSFDGASWSPAPVPSALVARWRHAMAGAPSGTILLFGGISGAWDLLDDAWLWDGAGFTPLPAVPVGLTPRADASMTWDPTRGVTVLFGGSDGTSQDDTWEFDGTGWAQGPSAPYAPPSPTITFSADLGRAVLYGTGAWDTWEYDGAAWTPGSSLGVPPLLDAGTGSLPVERSVVLFGGQNQSLPSTNDLWLYGDCPDIDVVPPTLPGAHVAIPYDELLTANGTSPHTFAFITGALPPGLALDAAGMLTGTPMASGAFSFVVDVTDGAGCVGRRSYGLDVDTCTGLELYPPVLPEATLGLPYGAQLVATGGVSPYVYAVSAGSIPPGVFFDSGVFSGTPTQLGNWQVDISAVDAVGCVIERHYTLSVGELLDLVTGAGTGSPNPNRIRVRDADGTGPLLDLFAYGASGWGVNVGAGDIAGATADEILSTPGPGAELGPHLKAFDRTGAPLTKVSFYAYGTLRFGALLASADMDADAFDEILTGAGPGEVFGPHVRAFDVDDGAPRPVGAVSFFAYGTLRWGVNVASGNVDGDSYSEILTGAGPGIVFAPVVRGFNVDGAALDAIPGLSFAAFPEPKYGVVVAAGDVERDGFDEIGAAPGPGPTASCLARVRGFDHDGATVAALPGYDVVVMAGANYGARLALGDLDGDLSDDLLGGAGPDPSASARVGAWRYDTIGLLPLPVAFDAFPTLRYGVSLAVARLGI